MKYVIETFMCCKPHMRYGIGAKEYGEGASVYGFHILPDSEKPLEYCIYTGISGDAPPG